MVTAMPRTHTGMTPFLFGPGFLHDHVGQIIDDPTVAIVELVANCYDAGADRVNIVWPSLPGDPLSITDNGTGMTRDEFEKRWKTLAYDRPTEQGSDVVFPPGARKAKRTAFGHNGKGRFSPLCFADEYQVETWKDGHCTTAKIQMAHGKQVPFLCKIQADKVKSGHGTCISTVAQRVSLPSSFIRDLIGFKFAVDPTFTVKVNGDAVKLLSLAGLSTQQVDADDHGTITVHRLDPLKQERTMRLKGIAWWVNHRMVGEPSWDGLDGPGQYLDGRTIEARRFSFIVEADLLRSETKSDWSGFKETPLVVPTNIPNSGFVLSRHLDNIAKPIEIIGPDRARDFLDTLIVFPSIPRFGPTDKMQARNPPFETPGRILLRPQQVVTRITPPRALPPSGVLIEDHRVLDAVPK